MSFPVYTMAIMSFFGWFFFLVFGGVGMSALPIDLILDYIHRPKLRHFKDKLKSKDILKAEAGQLIEEGN